MEFSTEFWIQIIVYLLPLGVTFGSVLTRIKQLEKKMDKHNNLIERLTRCEESTKSAHNRLNEINE